MKKLVAFCFMVLVSSIAQAENKAPVIVSDVDNSAVKAEQIIAKAEQSGPSVWIQLDTNKDGAISKVEAANNKQISENWASLDLNKDGTLDTEELVQTYSLLN